MKKLLFLIHLTVTIYANKDIHRPKVVDMIRGKLEKPLIYIDDKEYTHFRMFKLRIHKEDYIQLFSYVKYLENQGRDAEAIKIYIDALNGLKNIPSEQSMSLIFRMMNEKVIVASLKEWYKHKNIPSELKNKLNQLLLLNDEYLVEILNNDNKISLSYVNKFPKIKKLANIHHQLFMEAVRNDSLDKYNDYSAKKKEEYLSFSNIVKYGYTQGKVKLYTFLGLEPNKSFIDEFQIISSIYEPRTYITKTIKEYREQVNDNKIFLESLKEIK